MNDDQRPRLSLDELECYARVYGTPNWQTILTLIARMRKVESKRDEANDRVKRLLAWRAHVGEIVSSGGQTNPTFMLATFDEAYDKEPVLITRG